MGLSPTEDIGGEPRHRDRDEGRMRTNSRSRGPKLVLGVLTLIVSLPELARAQQMGLFPLAPIRRQRVPCDQEDPIYKVYKHQYYGYHPTCWRTFPKGWGCPSPEAPDREKSFKELPLQAGEPLEPLPEEEMPGAPGPGAPRPAVPALPGGVRSPFEEGPETEKPGATPRGGQAPLPTPPGDPFELDKPDKPATPPAGGEARPRAPGAASTSPELSRPTERPEPAQAARTSRNDAGSTEDVSPVLALPSINLPPVEDPGVPFGTEPPPPAVNPGSEAPAVAGTTAPRRSILGSLFNNLGLNWTRR
jgi:hypothetical protein